jgi:hypothetical protein
MLRKGPTIEPSSSLSSCSRHDDDLSTPTQLVSNERPPKRQKTDIIGTDFGSRGRAHFYSIFVVLTFYIVHVGIAAHYYSWHLMQLFLGLVGFFAIDTFVILKFYLPETSHLNNKGGVNNLDPNSTPRSFSSPVGHASLAS